MNTRQACGGNAEASHQYTVPLGPLSSKITLFGLVRVGNEVDGACRHHVDHSEASAK